ncbi:MAG: hypothetical protein AUG09_02775 [Acidobacteria bacterium 13_1_20CM_2_68_7]|nr:MAG: hypothetical protein AUG09_02775 [Acidobacteria bacterium 13_1_20CM_2_68_7]
MRASVGSFLPLLILAAGLCLTPVSPAHSDDLSRFEKERGRMMLGIIRKDLDKYYYDESFHGVKLDEVFKEASGKIDQAQSLSRLLGVISLPLLELDDSHTFFIPPERSARFQFGWQMQAIGDRCYVTSVQEGSDAQAKGLKQGDRVISVNDREPVRENLWAITYAHRVLAPRTTLPMVVQSPGEEPRRIEVAAKIQERKRIRRSDSPFDLGDQIREFEDEAYLTRHRFEEVEDGLCAGSGNIILWFSISAVTAAAPPRRSRGWQVVSCRTRPRSATSRAALGCRRSWPGRRAICSRVPWSCWSTASRPPRRSYSRG